MTRLITCSLLTAFVCSCVWAEDGKEKTFLSVADAGTDYLLQGEYSGMLETDGDNMKFGLQVIALGDHKFDAVCYPGGLPGDGWEGEKKFKASGETVDGMTKLTADGVGHAIIVRGSAQIFSEKDREVGTLNKVERKSPTLGAKPPAGAVVLFDG